MTWGTCEWHAVPSPAIRCRLCTEWLTWHERQGTGAALHVPTTSILLLLVVTRLKEKDNLRERLADAEDRGIPFLIFFGDQELAKARPARAASCSCSAGCDLAAWQQSAVTRAEAGRHSRACLLPAGAPGAQLRGGHGVQSLTKSSECALCRACKAVLQHYHTMQ